jgi:hypothetical protein
VLLGFALFVVWQALRLPYWAQTAPGPGFVPLWLGVLLAAAALALLAARDRGRRPARPRRMIHSAPRGHKEQPGKSEVSGVFVVSEEQQENSEVSGVSVDQTSGVSVDPTSVGSVAEARRIASITGFAAGAAALVYPLGLPLASGVFVAAVLFYLSPERRLANAVGAAATPVVIWILFVRWLTVPLPRGIFGF